VDFGNVSNVNSLQFDLPPDDPATLQFLKSRAAPRLAPRIYVGAPVWTPQEWVGRIYPEKTPAKDFLYHYSRQFNSIELNSTFYSLPDLTQVEHWKNQTPPQFRFSPKFPQAISRDLQNVNNAQIDHVFATLRGFGDNLGLSFIQMPPSFAPRDLHLLKKLALRKPEGFALAVEVRHEAFFKNHTLIEDFARFLEDHQLSSVITDVAGRRDVLHTSLRTPTAMIRFKGNELHPSDYKRVDDWVDKLENWIKLSVEEISFFVHHGTFVNVPELSIYLIKRLNQRLNLALETPRWVEPKADPQLRLL
jgi:uncharacterized protein YecE (DUF72 family)